MVFDLLLFTSTWAKETLQSGSLKVKKTWKRVLTNELGSVKIIKHFAKGSGGLDGGKCGTGPWKLNNDESKEPDKIQKSFICTRIEKIQSSNCERKCSKERRSSWKDWYSLRTDINTIVLRVWSWLRTNAGGVPNTCKSNEALRQISSERSWRWLSGGRVSNAWATCPSEGDSVWKRTLIPHNITKPHDFVIKDFIA